MRRGSRPAPDPREPPRPPLRLLPRDAGAPGAAAAPYALGVYTDVGARGKREAAARQVSAATSDEQSGSRSSVVFLGVHKLYMWGVCIAGNIETFLLHLVTLEAAAATESRERSPVGQSAPELRRVEAPRRHPHLVE